MLKNQYLRSEFDSCVYNKELKEGEFVYLLLYVDDILIASRNKRYVDELKVLLSSEFEMKDLGEAKKILGMEITRDRARGVLTISQGYIHKILGNFVMEQAKAVGSLMYLMICTRPDLAFAVGMVCKYMSNPIKDHWQAVKWLLRYLRGSEKTRLVFRNEGVFTARGYCDADYAGDADKRRSTTGMEFTVGGNPVSWRSSLQKVVALSSTESEYIALSEASREAVWLRGFMSELGFSQDAVSIYCDSQSAIAIAKNALCNERTKNVQTKYHFVRDLIADGWVKVLKIATEYNPADIFTKVLPVGKFKGALDMLRVTED